VGGLSKDLFVFDLDGTLVHNLPEGGRGIPLSLQAEIQRISKFSSVVIATGRRYRAALIDTQVLPQLPFVIVHNGLVIKNEREETVFSAHLKHDRALEIAQFIESCGYPVFFVADGHRFSFDYAYTEEVLERFKSVQSLQRRPFQKSMILKSSSQISSMHETPLLEVASLGRHEEMRDLRSKIQGILPQGFKAVLVENLGYSEFCALEIFEEQHSKWAAACWIRDQLGLGRMIAVGDDGNDQEMIQFADIGVAMSHAREEIRALSRRVVDGPLGLTEFLKEFGE